MVIVGIDISKRSHETAIINEKGILLEKPFHFLNHAEGLQKLLDKFGNAERNEIWEYSVFLIVSRGF